MFELLLFGGLVTVGYFVGASREAQHYQDIKIREEHLQKISLRSDKKISKEMIDGKLVSASVVVANDYFKMVATSVRSFFGGEVRSQESLLDRARREAMLRLKAKASTWGAKEIIGFRMETSKIDNAGVEIFVYGTAIK